MKQISLRPHDVVVALQLVIAPQQTYAQLSTAIGLSASEVHEAVKRLRISRLVGTGVTRLIRRPRALEEFIAYGVPVVFPAQTGAATRGIPTAHSGPKLSHLFPANAAKPAAEDVYVWPHEDGQVRGTSLTPLYAGAPATARSNTPLYELLTLVDAIRIGRARERHKARALLSHALNVDFA